VTLSVRYRALFVQLLLWLDGNKSDRHGYTTDVDVEENQRKETRRVATPFLTFQSPWKKVCELKNSRAMNLLRQADRLPPDRRPGLRGGDQKLRGWDRGQLGS
jgi:hypothetical protein